MPPKFEELLAGLFAQAGDDAGRLTDLLLVFLEFHDLFADYRKVITRETIEATAQHESRPEYFVFLKLVGDSPVIRNSELKRQLLGFIFPEFPTQALPALLLLLQLTPASPLACSPAKEIPDTQLNPQENGQKLEIAFKDEIAQLFSQLSLSLSKAHQLCLDLVSLWKSFSDDQQIITRLQEITTQLREADNYIKKISTKGRELEDSLALTKVDQFTSQRLFFMRSVIRKLNHDLGNYIASASTKAYIIRQLLTQPQELAKYQGNPVKDIIDALNSAHTNLLPYIEGELKNTLFENPAALVIPDKTVDLKVAITHILDQQSKSNGFIPPHVTLRTEFNPEKLPIVLSELTMSSIVINLLGNAVRHMPKPGAITVRIYPSVRPRDQKKFVILEVKDEGEGIPPEILPHIFEDGFSRRGAGQVAGTGQGLTIVRDAVERHAGHIVALSQVNVGTTFRMAFPLVAETP